jgi:hypothetical protein
MHHATPGERLNWDVRANHLCASEVGAWLGVCPYAKRDSATLNIDDPRQFVLHRKRNPLDMSIFATDLERGHREEPVIIDILRQTMGFRIKDAPMGTLVRGELAATPDAVGEDGTFGVEIKSTSGEIRNAVPESHRYQCTTGMLCAGDALCDTPFNAWLYASGTSGGTDDSLYIISAFCVEWDARRGRQVYDAGVEFGSMTSHQQ